MKEEKEKLKIQPDFFYSENNFFTINSTLQKRHLKLLHGDTKRHFLNGLDYPPNYGCPVESLDGFRIHKKTVIWLQSWQGVT